MKADEDIMLSDDMDSEEILRDASNSDYCLQLSPIFPSRLKPFGSLCLTPKINLGDEELPQFKEDEVFISQAINSDKFGNSKCYETPANLLIISSPKILKKKCLQPTKYPVRAACKRLQLNSNSASKKFTRLMAKKKLKASSAKESKPIQNECLNANVLSSQHIEHAELEIPTLTGRPKCSPISGCSPLSYCSSDISDTISGEERKESLEQYDNLFCAPQIITSTPVDDGGRFDYSVSAITEGYEETSSVPFRIKESRFCCSSEIILSETNAEYSSGETYPNSDKENIDPDANRAAFDAFMKKCRIRNYFRQEKIKCTYKRIGTKQKPLEELIHISFSTSQPVRMLQINADNRLSISQPEMQPVKGKSFLLSGGLDHTECVDTDGVEL